MDLIKSEFTNMRGFLQAWTVSEECEPERKRFLKNGGAQDITDMWLPTIQPNIVLIPPSLSSVTEHVIAREVDQLL